MAGKPGRKCTICGHPERAQIEAEVQAGATLRNVAQAHGVKLGAVFRHMKNHAFIAPIEKFEVEPEPVQEAPAGIDDDDIW